VRRTDLFDDRRSSRRDGRGRNPESKDLIPKKYWDKTLVSPTHSSLEPRPPAAHMMVVGGCSSLPASSCPGRERSWR
jgi:hypothetical protein